jgi:hypothetical protein
LLPWPRNFLLPPLLQIIEKKHGKWKQKKFITFILRRTRQYLFSFTTLWDDWEWNERDTRWK